MALDACPGLITLHEANDGLVARVRLPGGYAPASTWRALAGLAVAVGDGCLDLTARGNVQLRGLRAGDTAELARQAADAGLLPSAAHDRARNITASPLAGLGGCPPLRDLVTALDGELLADPALAVLPGRFLFAVDDGTGGASLAASDIGLRATPAPGAPDGAWFELLVAGRETGVRLPPDRAVPAALAAARAAAARGVGETLTRIAALPDGGASVAAALGGTLGSPAPADSRLPPGLAPGVAPAAPAAPATALVAVAPLSRLSAGQAGVLAGQLRAGEAVRLGIAGRVVVPLGRPAAEALAAAAAAGLIVADSDPRAGVTACSGSACKRSRADVRSAARFVTHHPRTHWAGCERACGCPPDAQPVVALDATRYRLGDSEVS